MCRKREKVNPQSAVVRPKVTCGPARTIRRVNIVSFFSKKDIFGSEIERIWQDL